MTKQGVLTLWRQQREEQIQDTENMRPSKGHSPPEDGRGRDESGHGNKATKGHSPPEDGRGRDESGHGNKATKGHSQAGDRRGRVESGHRENVTERRALTIW